MNSSELVIIKFRISNTTQHHKEMPHLLLTPGWIVQFDVLFNNLTSHFKQSRFGLQLAMISNLTLSPTEEFRKDVLFSIDDELTPGNFEMTNFLLGESVSKLNNKKLVNTDKYLKNSTNPPAFIQIKPACFIDNQWRTVQNSRNVYVSKHQDLLNDEDSLRYSLPSIFYADRINPNTIDNNTGLMPIGIRLLNVSFGTPTDGFYAKTKFIVWTASFGLGNPPKDNLSSLLIGLIVCSMLIIVSAVILGILLVIILRRRTTLDRPILSHFVNDPIA
uniref:SJCHGC08990 protein n=1 Tax=Schistosoma japonicum TaxID=6182 RepID=Q5DDG5_SCHJA|nr:SJCHGC08990 protein [Schistosoma japonicum]